MKRMLSGSSVSRRDVRVVLHGRHHAGDAWVVLRDTLEGRGCTLLEWPHALRHRRGGLLGCVLPTGLHQW